MRQIAPLKIALLALMLAVSHVALLSHVTAHFSPDLEQCELCVSQAQLLTAIPSADQDFHVDPGYGAARPDTIQPVFNIRYSASCRQRAPPLSSA